jgi:RNA polymerase sigma-70 factor (ECF subfamily)
VDTDQEPNVQAEDGLATEIASLYEPAFRLAYGMLRDREEAEDVLQEAAFQAWRKRASLREPTALRAWFLTIVANQCRMTMRRRSWWSTLRVPWLDRGVPSPDDSLAAAADLRHALAALPADQRLVCILRFYLDLPYEEVATVMGTSAGAARMQAGRAVRRLQRALTADGDEP